MFGLFFKFIVPVTSGFLIALDLFLSNRFSFQQYFGTD